MEGLRPGWAVKAILVIIITSLLFRCVSATNHSVGGSTGWDLASNLRAWSAATTFDVGDSLVFTYSPLHDVLEVNQSDFEECRISQPIGAYRNGETVIQLRETGSRYFICGRLGHCNMGLKLQVQVLPELTPSNATDNSDNFGNGSGGRGGGGGGRRFPPRRMSPPPPPPSNGTSRKKPELSLPPVASPCKASDAEAVGSVNCWYLPCIALLLILSSWPRETLRFLFSFLHIVI